MLFTVMEDSWANQDGDLVKRTSLTLMPRQIPAGLTLPPGWPSGLALPR